jgi:hypothetical protein
MGMIFPLSSVRPGPTATIFPSWGFSFAVSGMMIPPEVLLSAVSEGFTITLSARGLIFNIVPPFNGVDEKLALDKCEC